MIQQFHGMRAVIKEICNMEEQKGVLLGIEMPLSEIDELLCEQSQGKELKVVDGRVIAEYHVSTKEEKLDTLRGQREPLLNAFDTYKTNVEYGIETETAEEHTAMLQWYKALRDLDESAFINIPERIRYYL